MKQYHYVVVRRVVIDYVFPVTATSQEEAEAKVEQLTNEEAYASEEMDRHVEKVWVRASRNSMMRKG